MLHRRAPYIARIFEISIEMLQCNKSERAAKRCCSLTSVECLISQNRKAKRTNRGLSCPQLQTGWTSKPMVISEVNGRVPGDGVGGR